MSELLAKPKTNPKPKTKQKARCLPPVNKKIDIIYVKLSQVRNSL